MSDQRERPILFSGPMVRAILAGRKTQTRRPVDMRHVGFIGGSGMQDDPSCWGFGDEDGCWHVLDQSCPAWYGADFGVTSESYRITSPFGYADDLLWVRETWQFADWTLDGEPFIGYRADDAQELRSPDSEEWGERLANIWADLSADGRQPAADLIWRPSIHMPRWASRLTLEVTGVRVERLQAISADDARAEGAWRTPAGSAIYSVEPPEFEHLWDDSYGSRPGCSWSDNPWVWVVEFRRIEA